MRILELENRCTGNRTEGSNPSIMLQKYLAGEHYRDGYKPRLTIAGARALTNLILSASMTPSASIAASISAGTARPSAIAQRRAAAERLTAERYDEAR